ncbi:MAG TPA: hypothetical protein VN541_21680 [Tepidisphaeraceae bacterium]|nr:hypothetical protein [Tepidisphaeraceae bacterium]
MTKMKSIEQEAAATLRTLGTKDPGLKQLLKKAYGYSVFPSVGKASLVVGGSWGKGAVYRYGKFIGYATIGQTTLGVQIGGDTFTEVIVFQNKPAFDRLKNGKLSFAADASAVLVKAGAAAARGFGPGTQAFVYGKGGMLLEAAIGGQKFRFKPAGEAQEDERHQDEQESERDQGDEGLMSRATGAFQSAASGVSEFVKGHPVAATAIGIGVAGGATLLIIRAIRSAKSAPDQGQDAEQEQMSSESGDNEEADQDTGDEAEEYASAGSER